MLGLIPDICLCVSNVMCIVLLILQKRLLLLQHFSSDYIINENHRINILQMNKLAMEIWCFILLPLVLMWCSILIIFKLFYSRNRHRNVCNYSIKKC